jgi:hypothetical protein
MITQNWFHPKKTSQNKFYNFLKADLVVFCKNNHSMNNASLPWGPVVTARKNPLFRLFVLFLLCVIVTSCIIMHLSPCMFLLKTKIIWNKIYVCFAPMVYWIFENWFEPKSSLDNVLQNLVQTFSFLIVNSNLENVLSVRESAAFLLLAHLSCLRLPEPANQSPPYLPAKHPSFTSLSSSYGATSRAPRRYLGDGTDDHLLPYKLPNPSLQP